MTVGAEGPGAVDPRDERVAADLTYQKAGPAELAGFLCLLREKTSSYLEPMLRSMGWTWQEFGEMFRSVGDVRAIHRGSMAIGFVWIERRDRVLHLHGLALEPEHRRQGVGTRALADLEDEFRGHVDAIELGVHRSNDRARRLYERMGYRVARSHPETEFDILRKPLLRASRENP